MALTKDTALIAALLDHLLHHAKILNIQWESFRLKDKQKAGIVPARMKKEEQIKENASNLFFLKRFIKHIALTT